MNSVEKHFIIPMCINSNEKSKLSVSQINELNRLYMNLKQQEIQTYREMILKNNEFQDFKNMCENTIMIYEIYLTLSILYKNHGYTKSYIRVLL